MTSSALLLGEIGEKEGMACSHVETADFADMNSWKLRFSKTTLGEEDNNSYSDEVTIRTMFPESWLWTDVKLPVNCPVDKPSWWVNINVWNKVSIIMKILNKQAKKKKNKQNNYMFLCPS